MQTVGLINSAQAQTLTAAAGTASTSTASGATTAAVGTAASATAPATTSALVASTSLQTVPASVVSNLTSAQLGAAQVQAIAPATLAAISPAQVAAMTPTQLSALSSSQLAALTPAQVQAMAPAQLSSFTAEQVSALQTAGLLTSAQAQTLTAAVGKTSALAVPAATGSTLAASNSAATQAVSAVSASTRVEASGEISQNSAVPAVGINAVGTTPSSSSSSEPLSNMSVVSLVSGARASTVLAQGVLTVAVLGESTGGNTGVSFVKQADASIKLQVVNGVAPVSIAALQLNVPYLAIETRNASNVSVTFRSGIVGDLLLIAAPNAAARDMVRSELPTMLSAAIETLGSAEQISLDKLTSIVLDLR